MKTPNRNKQKGGESRNSNFFKKSFTLKEMERNQKLVEKEDKMIQQLKNFLKDEDGVTAVEYAVMAALIALVVIAGATILGTNTNATFTTVGGAIPGGGS